MPPQPSPAPLWDSILAQPDKREDMSVPRNGWHSTAHLRPTASLPLEEKGSHMPRTAPGTGLRSGWKCWGAAGLRQACGFTARPVPDSVHLFPPGSVSTALSRYLEWARLR